MNNVLKTGFTLAEVLITLAIIGVIAAITIPALQNKINKEELVVGLKKAYATMGQISYKFIAENGSVAAALSNVTTDKDFANIFASKLNIRKNCAAGDTGCFSSGYLTLSQSSTGDDPNWRGTLLTNDNMSYSFYLWDKNCNRDIGDTGNTLSPLYKACGQIAVDVNGPNKGPATYGRDLFVFWLPQKGVYPRGSYNEGYYGFDCTSLGTSCASKVLKEGAMNY